MTIPRDFVGAWERRSIALADRPPSEPASVIWVQGTSAYADLRIPVDATDPVECFAGRTTWDPPHLHWSHELDLAAGPAASTDVGAVEWVDGDLVERGVFVIEGTEVPYVEVWHRLAGSDGPIVEHEEAGASMRVAVGEHELVVVDRRAEGGGFSACYRRLGHLLLAHGVEEVLV